jgi:hypothetical protein
MMLSSKAQELSLMMRQELAQRTDYDVIVAEYFCGRLQEPRCGLGAYRDHIHIAVGNVPGLL